MENVKFNYNKMEKATLEASKLGIEIDTRKKLQKLEISIILAEALNILRDKENYNTNLSKNNPDYVNSNHAYNKINELMHKAEHKSIEKLLKVTSKVLLMNAKIDFSAFVESFKDLEIFEKTPTWYAESDLRSNKAFIERATEISLVLNLQADLQSDKIIVAKPKRKIIGAREITINDTSYSLMVLLKEYKIKSLSIDDFNAVLALTREALKEYHDTIK